MFSSLSSLSTALNVASYFASNNKEDEDPSVDFWEKQEFDPHSVIYSICTGKFKGDSKPVYWLGTHVVILQPTQPFEYRPCSSATINVQGPIRTCQNWWSGTTIANRRVIYRFHEIIHKALYWDQPHAEGNEDVKKVYGICLKGLDSFSDPYKGDIEIQKEIDKCKELIQNALEKPIEKPLYGPLAERVNALWSNHHRAVAQEYIIKADELQGDITVAKDNRCTVQIDSLEQLLQERGQQFHGILNERKV